MLRHLTEKEFRLHLLDYRFLGIAVCCVVLSALGVATGVKGYDLELKAYSEEAGRLQADLDSWIERNNYNEFGSRTGVVSQEKLTDA